MKTVWLMCFICVILSVDSEQAERAEMNSDQIPAPGQYERVFEKTVTRTLRCRYLLYLPDGYDQKQQKWPMILFLHGIGERGDDLEKVKKHGPPKLIEQGKKFPFIVVSPQCPEGQWWSPEVLINLLDEIVDRYAVDTDRIYLTGLSMGGFGTWDLACLYSERFAAIAPICGGGRGFMADRLKSVPVWAFHGAKDNLVPLRESEEMVQAVNAFGGNAKLTVYPDAYHDSWTETYNNQELYDWFLRHRREKLSK